MKIDKGKLANCDIEYSSGDWNSCDKLLSLTAASTF